MSDIQNKISDDVKAAMRGKDKPRLATLRLIQAAFKQKIVDERITLDDPASITILTKMAKQHRDSIVQFTTAGRDDLVQIEQFELNIIESYLPAKLSDDEIEQILTEVITDTGAASIKDMGKVMAVLTDKLQGRADMSAISGLVKTRLSG